MDIEKRDVMLKEKLLNILKETGKSSFPELLEILDIKSSQTDELKILNQALLELIEQGHIYETRKEDFLLIEDSHLLRGTLQGTSRDFLYFIPDDPEEEDIFIGSRFKNGAIHKDTVLVEKLRELRDHRSPEGRVIKIVGRNPRVTGVLHSSKDYGFLILDDKRYGFDLFIGKEDLKGANDRDHVVAEITAVPRDSKKNPVGKVTEVIGHQDDVGVDLKAIAYSYGLRDTFPKEVLREAEEAPQSVSEEEMKGREDFRDLFTVTMDGEFAKDLDDAISLKKEGNFYRLWVHIADVAHYVKKASFMDEEAFKRGNSVYLLNQVLPMLPRKLSNGICSLNPHKDRLTLSVEMKIDSTGRVVDHDLYESVIQSDHRLVYHEVSDYLEKDSDIYDSLEDGEELKKLLDEAKELQNILQEKRKVRGALGFNVSETMILFNDQGKPTDIYPDERRVSNKIIEEFMLVTNETVGEHFGYLELPFLYRIHEEPDEEKVEAFRKLIVNFGYLMKGSKTYSKDFQKIIEEVEGKPEEALLSMLLLRSMKKAKYSDEPNIHFGLATDFYSHFTAPIRRYSDLTIHRIIKEYLNNKNIYEDLKSFYKPLEEIAEQTSETERVAELAEREAVDMKMAEYMEDHIGEIFPGIISSVTGFGVFISLPNTVEGLAKYDWMKDDYYIYDEKSLRAYGERTGRELKMGQEVKVRVLNASKEKREIDFEILRD